VRKIQAERAGFEKSDFITLRHLSTYDASRKYAKTYFSFKVTLGNWRSSLVIKIWAKFYTKFTQTDLDSVFELLLKGSISDEAMSILNFTACQFGYYSYVSYVVAAEYLLE